MIAPVSLPAYCICTWPHADMSRPAHLGIPMPWPNTVPTGGADIRGGPRDYPPTTVSNSEPLTCKASALPTHPARVS